MLLTVLPTMWQAYPALFKCLLPSKLRPHALALRHLR